MSKPVVPYDQLELALMWASDGGGFGNAAWIRRSDGRIIYEGGDADPDDDEPAPADLGDESRYVALPDARELDLGNALAFAFADEVAPSLRDAVRDAFRRKGAWRAFRDLVDRAGLDEAWHRYKDRETRRALVRWARAEGFEVPGEPVDDADRDG